MDDNAENAANHGSAGVRSRLSAWTRWPLVLGAAAVLLVADQLSKAWAFGELCLLTDGYRCDVTAAPIELFWTLQFNLAFNTGMAFSRGSGAGPIIGSIAVLIVVVLLIIARKLNSRLQLVLVGVVAGGALGNVIDRLFRAEDGFMSGAVVDFIDPQWWPIFNVADAAVVVGGIALALTGLTTEDPDGPASSEEPVAAPGATTADAAAAADGVEADVADAGKLEAARAEDGEPGRPTT